MPTDGQEPTDGNEGQEPSANPQAGAANPKPEPKAEAPQADADAKEQGEKKKLREEAAASRVRAKAAEDALAKLQDSLKTEDERKSERLKQLELAETTWRDKERASNKKLAIALAVADAETSDREVLTMLVNQYELQYDDETGAPLSDSLTDAITAILQSKPYLAKAQAQQEAAPAPKATSAGAGTNLPRKNEGAITRESVDKMSYEDINRLYNSGQLPEAMRSGALNKRG
jgi:DNA polymerase III gamma/tau subunit